MRYPTKALLAVLATTAVAAAAAAGLPESGISGHAAQPAPEPELTVPIYLRRRHGDDEHNSPTMNSTSHVSSHSHNQPLLELNETAVLEKFGPDPLSYYAHDFELQGAEKSLGGLMIFHIVIMSLAFFVVLPFGESSQCSPGSQLTRCRSHRASLRKA
jgi:hypothetical protein